MTNCVEKYDFILTQIKIFKSYKETTQTEACAVELPSKMTGTNGIDFVQLEKTLEVQELEVSTSIQFIPIAI